VAVWSFYGVAAVFYVVAVYEVAVLSFYGVAVDEVASMGWPF